MWLKIIAVPLPVLPADGFARKLFPLRRRSKGFEVLKGSTVQRDVGCPNDSAELEQSLLINLILVEQVGVIAKITQEPIQFPQGSFGAIEPT